MKPRIDTLTTLAFVLFASLAPVGCGGPGGPGGGDGEGARATASQVAAPAAPADPGEAFYNQGKYSEALPLLEESAAKGKTGTLLYQIGFAKGSLSGPTGAVVRKTYWTEAKPLLEGEIATPDGATLERLYYLTVIAFDEADLPGMEKYARQAVDTIEKGPDPNSLSGEDWFRLGRLHDFLRGPSEAEAAYRRALAAFRKVPAINPAYQALTLVRVADIDFDSRRFDVAATGYEEALTLVPTLDQVKPFRMGLALFGAGRFDESIAAFKKDRDPETMTESQYGADLAQKAKDVGGLNIADADGAPMMAMDLDTLDTRIRDAAREYRAAREKHSLKPGDSLPAEVAQYQKRFVSLMRERLLQTQDVQEFCLKEGIADLVRR
jgi:tetratricopeptide (TPR) repeat protein